MVDLAIGVVHLRGTVVVAIVMAVVLIVVMVITGVGVAATMFT